MSRERNRLGREASSDLATSPRRIAAAAMEKPVQIDDLDVRRRRALWRATHRGTKELDILIGSYAKARLDGMDAAELTRFEKFLEQQETELQALLLSPAAARDVPFADIVNTVRAFHGMPSA
jgi:antitoxin CptB